MWIGMETLWIRLGYLELMLVIILPFNRMSDGDVDRDHTKPSIDSYIHRT